MRFKEFLAEGAITFNKAMSVIKTDCQYFLKRSDRLPVYRGMHTATTGIYYSNAPTDRAPKDSDTGFNLMFNAGWDIAFDYIDDVRKKSVYATGSTIQAQQYGKVSYIFPKGAFSFGYSVEYEDSYDRSCTICMHIHDALKTNLKINIPGNVIGQLFSDLEDSTAKEFKDGNKDIDTVIDHCLESWLDTYEYEKTKNFNMHKELVKALKDVFSADFIDSENLPRAIKLKHEIGFYEFAGYYSVPVSSVEIALKKDTSEMAEKFKEAFKSGSGPSAMYPYLLARIEEA